MGSCKFLALTSTAFACKRVDRTGRPYLCVTYLGSKVGLVYAVTFFLKKNHAVLSTRLWHAVAFVACDTLVEYLEIDGKKPRPRNPLLHAPRQPADSIKLLCEAEHRFRDEMRLLQPNHPQRRFSTWQHFLKFQSKFYYHQNQPTRRTSKLGQTVDLSRNCEFSPLPESGGKYLKAREVQARVLI